LVKLNKRLEVIYQEYNKKWNLSLITQIEQRKIQQIIKIQIILVIYYTSKKDNHNYQIVIHVFSFFNFSDVNYKYLWKN
jgi:hypothetical protein